MSEGFGTYGFLSWLRQGLATGIRRPDAPASEPAPRAALDLAVEVRDRPPVAVADAGSGRGLGLIGTGEIVGLNAHVVSRVWPERDDRGVETNYFPQLELAQADLPWRYTPARAGVRGRLRPWMCLIALKEGEFALPPATPPVVVVAPAAPLPRLGQAWAWAHVQVGGQQTWDPASIADQATLRRLMAVEPARVTARLLCPRRLEPKIAYTVFLVPVFERGRLAGLGEKIPDEIDALQPAWEDVEADAGTANPRGRDLRLPFYYSWHFETADTAADFEALVDLVKAIGADALAELRVGERPMDAGDPGLGLPAAAARPLGLGGALELDRAGDDTDGTPDRWDGRKLWVAALRRVVNAPDEMLRHPGAPRQMVVPLYGRWHALRPRLETEPAPPPWFDQLNADPRTRVAAALGTQVVQAQQQQLMASAWRQVERIRVINAELRQAQLAREAATRLHARYLAPAGPEAVLELTAPVHGRIRHDERTARAALAASPIAPGLFDAGWRRARARAAPFGSRRASSGRRPPLDIIDRANRGAVSPARKPTPPSGMSDAAGAGVGAIVERARSGPFEHRWVGDGGSGREVLGARMFLFEAISWGPGRLDLFAVGRGGLHHRPMENGAWSPWQSLGEVTPLRILSWGPGRLDVLAQGAPGALHRWFEGGAWSPNWQPLNELGPFPAASPGPGRLELLAHDADGILRRRRYENGNWLVPEPLGLYGSPVLATDASGADFAFGIDAGGILHLLGAGGSELDLGAFVIERAVPLGNGQVTLLLRVAGARDSVLWSVTSDVELWTAPEELGAFDLLEALPAGLGRVDLFLRDGDGVLHHRRYQASVVQAEEGMPGFAFNAAAATGVGQVDLIAESGSRILRRRRFTDAGWSDWSTLGEFALRRAVSSAPGRLDLLGEAPSLGDSPGPSGGPPREYGAADDQVAPPPSDTIDQRGTAWGAFGQAAEEALATLARLPPQPAPTPKADLPALGAALVEALEPRRTIEAGYVSRLRLVPGKAWQGADPLGEVMAAPEFPQPMMIPLRELGQDWLLPGLDRLPPNKLTLLRPNRRFIEAYMAGLNHEMARELLVNGYPTDLRGTTFRQFWDRSGYVDPNTGRRPDPESLRDIAPMHLWRARLGEHSTVPEAMSVLLIRGDLLRRYPDALIYAAKGERESPADGGRRSVKWQRDADRKYLEPLRTADADEAHPIFVGALDPDISFFAFALDLDEAKGDPGWYFILEEQPQAIRFGLDVGEDGDFGQTVPSWEEISWAHLASSAGTLAGIAYINLDADLPDTRQLDDPAGAGPAWHADRGLGRADASAADLAYITLQRPARVAFHASDLLNTE